MTGSGAGSREGAPAVGKRVVGRGAFLPYFILVERIPGAHLDSRSRQAIPPSVAWRQISGLSHADGRGAVGPRTRTSSSWRSFPVARPCALSDSCRWFSSFSRSRAAQLSACAFGPLRGVGGPNVALGSASCRARIEASVMSVRLPSLTASSSPRFNIS
jgi:hypothetical protein